MYIHLLRTHEVLPEVLFSEMTMVTVESQWPRVLSLKRTRYHLTDL
jgi:hypothetical protein